MICFADQENDKLARQQSWLGIDKDTFSRSESGGTYKWFYDVPDLGYKYHGNSVMAAIGITQLKYLDQDNAYRRQIATWYQYLLQDIPKLRIVPVDEDCESSRHLFQIRVPRRDEVLLALNNCGIYPGVHYRDNTEYEMYSQQPSSCPNARKFSDEVISLPIHLRITRDDVVWICTELKTILSKI
jgi:dTDP-4-amino-4,6-dideoxygalactose transaminase